MKQQGSYLPVKRLDIQEVEQNHDQEDYLTFPTQRSRQYQRYRSPDSIESQLMNFNIRLPSNYPYQTVLKLACIMCIFLFMFALLVFYKNGVELPEKEPQTMSTKQILNNREEESTNISNIVVHLIPHSHDDVGWLKTVDQYFYGAKKDISKAGVQYILDSVVTELTQHPQYKFSIVEMAYLYRWWRQASQRDKTRMKKLVENGQIQFINAGWCASDEATIYYQDFIDQMTVGLGWLKQTFKYIPDVAWHVDPFGHHASTAALFSKLGFNSLFFGRIDYQDKINRVNTRSLQFIWRPEQYDNSSDSYIFTHILYYHYSPPPDSYFEGIEKGQPIIDNKKLPGYNLEKRAIKLVEYFKMQSQKYRTMDIMHTIGQDFTYMNARIQFKNFDKLINYINKNDQFGIKIKYSTPGQYIKAISREHKTYPHKQDDFFPYSDNQHSMWTGYFTSRVALKGFVKDFSRFIQTARKHIAQLKISYSLPTINKNPKKIQELLFNMEMALGILQHHDAVAGTAKQLVTNDYISTGMKSINKFNQFYKEVKKQQIQRQTGQRVKTEDMYINLFWNQTGNATGISQKLNNNQIVLVSLHNPGSKGILPIRLKVPRKDLNIVSQSSNLIQGDVMCSNIKDPSDCQLIFHIYLEQSSNTYIKLMPAKNAVSKVVQVKEQVENIKEFYLGVDKVSYNKESHNFQLNFMNGKTQTFKIQYNYYQGWAHGGQPSGAYIFRPKNDVPKPYSEISKIYYIDGKTTVIIILEGDKTSTKAYFSKSPKQVLENGILIESFLDSIPIQDHTGKEVILNVKTDVKNGGKFYTDSMGLQEQVRMIDFRPTWKYQPFEATAGNFYPINSFVRIFDYQDKRNITLLTDRSQGGSVLRQGQFSILIHRRLLFDDYRGVEQPLNQVEADGKGLKQSVRHYLVFGSNYRVVQKRNDQPVLPTFATSNAGGFYKVFTRLPHFKVPKSVKLYLRPFEDDSYLLRLHNTNPISSKSVFVNLEWQMEEQTLAANQNIALWREKQLFWIEEGKPIQKEKAKQQIEAQTPDNFLTKFIKRIDRGFQRSIPQAWRDKREIKLKPFQMKAFRIRRTK